MTYAQTSLASAPATTPRDMFARAEAARSRVATLLATPRTSPEIAAAAERKALADALFGPREDTMDAELARTALAHARAGRSRVAQLLQCR